MKNLNNKTTNARKANSMSSAAVRIHRLPVFILVLVLLMQAPTMASEKNDAHTKDLIRAAMVYNFCKFVDWPKEEKPNRLVLGVMGGDFSTPDFSSIEGKSVKELPLEVRNVSSRKELAECNLVFISEIPTTQMLDTFAESRNESILTISEIEDFCVQGGIIQMVPRRGKMRFFINRQAADDAGLTLSSQLLKMARIVEGD